MNSFLGVGVYGGQVYPEPEPESTPEPVNPITKQINPFFMDMDMNINSNAPAWYSSLLNYINNIRAELMMRIEQCCSKSRGTNSLVTMRRFREKIPKKISSFGFGQDYSDDDYDESGPQPYKQVYHKTNSRNNEHPKPYPASYNNHDKPSSYHSSSHHSAYGTSTYKKPSAYKTYHKLSYHKNSPKPYSSLTSYHSPTSYYKSTHKTYHKNPHTYENQAPTAYGSPGSSNQGSYQSHRQSPISYGSYSPQSYGQGPRSYGQGSYQSHQSYKTYGSAHQPYSNLPKTYWDMEGPGPHNPSFYGLSSFKSIYGGKPYQSGRTYPYKQNLSSLLGHHGKRAASYQNVRTYNGPRAYSSGSYNTRPSPYSGGPREYNIRPRAYNIGPRVYYPRPNTYHNGNEEDGRENEDQDHSSEVASPLLT